MKKALILQCWYSTPEDNWYPWLKKELEQRGYFVSVPDLPTIRTNLPDLKQMIDYVENTIKFDKNTVVIGHSIGCLLAMRLAEKHAYNTMALVAGWDFNDLTAEHRLFWTTPIDHQAIMQNTQRRYVFTSENDPYFTAFTSQAMSERLHAVCVRVIGAGHFTHEFGIWKLPQLLEVVEKMPR